ncbi:histidine phosphatase family protein [Yoonia sp.]|uniref:SixA phosphatase family protein n=1 Tax=Yoonia sp. TaxID=2212373 RepID=UPI0035C7AFA3
MTKRLILIRHAKSSWDDPYGDDHARVLNKRGRTSAQAIGAWLAEKGYLPEVLLCSDAARTRETAELALPQMAPQLLEKLYHAAPDTILELVQKQTAHTVAVIGHNPGLGIFANALVNAAPEHRRFSDYPTCATTVIDFADEVAPRAGTCVDFIVPRDLIGTSTHDIE